MRINVLFLLTVALVTGSCSRQPERQITEKEVRETQNAMVEVNRMLVQKDKQKITDYMRQHNLSLQESETGLWYGITKKGTGEPVKDGMTVTLEYDVRLLDGTRCYSSDSLGNKQFTVGKGEVESGLDEGVRLLQKGSEAVLILPPHLAFGFQGDGDKIPARSIIVYHLKIIKADAQAAS
ncbi:MAG TPA: FKBP-type peptidyl-prolyl cis-trans isomerase [Bacteroidales bacterium]|nr:FKBP-type peptidyl-prolyl cis-trans isomerase [Bacteroidales bacterium]